MSPLLGLTDDPSILDPLLSFIGALLTAFSCTLLYVYKYINIIWKNKIPIKEECTEQNPLKI